MGRAPVGSPMRNESERAPERLAPDASATAAVITAISGLSGRDPVELDVCLADHVDPDALDTLFPPRNGQEIELTLTVGTHEVTVRDDGTGTVVVARDGDRHYRTVVPR